MCDSARQDLAHRALLLRPMRSAIRRWRFPWTWWKALLQKRLLWYVCAQVRWMQPRYHGKLHFSAQQSIPPGLLRMQSKFFPMLSVNLIFCTLFRHLISFSGSHSNNLFRIVKKPCLESPSTQWKASQSVQDALVLTKTNKWHPQQCLCSAPVVSPNDSKLLFPNDPLRFLPKFEPKRCFKLFWKLQRTFYNLDYKSFNFK